MRKAKPISRHYILRKMGLIETMCFIHSNDRGWWFIKGGVVTFMLTVIKKKQ